MMNNILHNKTAKHVHDLHWQLNKHMINIWMMQFSSLSALITISHLLTFSFLTILTQVGSTIICNHVPYILIKAYTLYTAI